MKLGILTQPLYNNFGGILQNYALQTFLRKMGHDVCTINFQHKPLRLSSTSFVISYVKNIARLLIGRKVQCMNPYKQDKMTFSSTKEKGRFISQHINKMDVLPPLTQEWVLNQMFDGYVVGSDQVWRPKYSPSISNFFLDFTDTLNVKRVAYAASFGVDEWEFSNELTETAKYMLKSFDGVSVREKSGIKLCKTYLNTDAIHVIDPTMLLSSEEYRSLLSGNDKNEEYILCYTLDFTSELQKIITGLPEKYFAKVRYVSGENLGKEDISVEQWLNLIEKAKYVVTDSFHGTVFSILFHKPFYSVINKERGSERVRSLLEMFNLDVYQEEYDWQSVEDKLSQYRIQAETFLNKSLS